MDSWITWFSATVLAQVAAMVANAYANAVVAFDSAVTASAQAAAAVSAVDALPWTPGAYSVGDVRYSLVDGRTFRCYVAVSGATDPANDRPHWVCISAGPLPYLHVQEQAANGTYPPTATGSTWNARDLNTVVGSVTIPGAYLASGRVVLPPGEFEYYAASVAQGVNFNRVALYNVTDATYLNQSLGNYSDTYSAPGYTTNACSVYGKIKITSSATFELRHYASRTGMLGAAGAIGTSEIFAELIVKKVD
jgi:hypothetical protein